MSAPSGPIQVIPRGLLSLLQLKNLGRLPDVLLGEVRPQFDIGDYWKQAACDFEGLTLLTNGLPAGSAGLNGYTTALQVANDEVAWVDEYTVEVIVPLGAAESCLNVQPAMRIDANSPQGWLGLTDTNLSVTATAARAAQGIITARNFWVPQGAILGYYVGQVNTATNVTFNGRVRWARLQI
jgi:hypothetical protein